MIANRSNLILLGLGLVIGAICAAAFYELGGRESIWHRYDQWRTARQYDALLAQTPEPDVVLLERSEILTYQQSATGYANDELLFHQVDAEAMRPLTTEWNELQATESAQYRAALQPYRDQLAEYLGPIPASSVEIEARNSVDLTISHCPANPPTASQLTISGHWDSHTFAAYLLMPAPEIDNGRAVVALHGHGSSPEQLIGLAAEDYARQMAQRLVCAGYVVIVPAVSSNSVANNAISARLALEGSTLYGYMVSIVSTSLTVLEMEVGNRPVGLYGISNGGLIALFANALDERPAFVVAESILTNYWQSTLEPTLGQGRRTEYFFYFNGPLWQEFDMAQLALLSLPDTLIFTVGTLDPERAGWEAEWQQIEAGYIATGNDGATALIRFHGHHELAENYAIDKLEQLLP